MVEAASTELLAESGHGVRWPEMGSKQTSAPPSIFLQTLHLVSRDRVKT